MTDALKKKLEELKEIGERATPGPWRWRSERLEAPIPFKADCVEFVLKDSYQSILGMEQQILLAYLPWIQFSPKKWEDMQKANQDLIESARNHWQGLIEALEEAIHCGHLPELTKKHIARKLGVTEVEGE